MVIKSVCVCCRLGGVNWCHWLIASRSNAGLRLSPVRGELDHPVVCLEDRGEAFVSPPEGAEGAEGTDSSQPADLA